MKELTINEFINNNMSAEYEVYDEVKQKWVNFEQSCFNETKGGFPQISNPIEAVLLITVQDKVTKVITTFTAQGFKSNNPLVNIVYCHDEKDLLAKFIEFWNKSSIDVITGWNVKFFDIPYLIARMEYVFGSMDYANRMSPWNRINKREVNMMGKDFTVFEIVGVSILDYLDLYKKYVKTPRESYKLDNIAYVELGENKKKNPHKTFKEFYEGTTEITSKDLIRKEFIDFDTESYNRFCIKQELIKRGLFNK